MNKKLFRVLLFSILGVVYFFGLTSLASFYKIPLNPFSKYFSCNGNIAFAFVGSGPTCDPPSFWCGPGGPQAGPDGATSCCDSGDVCVGGGVGVCVKNCPKDPTNGLPITYTSCEGDGVTLDTHTQACNETTGQWKDIVTQTTMCNCSPPASAAPPNNPICKVPDDNGFLGKTWCVGNGTAICGTCPDGSLCNGNSLCAAGSGSGQRCTLNSDCPAGQGCSNRSCVANCAASSNYGQFTPFEKKGVYMVATQVQGAKCITSKTAPGISDYCGGDSKCTAVVENCLGLGDPDYSCNVQGTSILTEKKGDVCTAGQDPNDPKCQPRDQKSSQQCGCQPDGVGCTAGQAQCPSICNGQCQAQPAQQKAACLAACNQTCQANTPPGQLFGGITSYTKCSFCQGGMGGNNGGFGCQPGNDTASPPVSCGPPQHVCIPDNGMIAGTNQPAPDICVDLGGSCDCILPGSGITIPSAGPCLFPVCHYKVYPCYECGKHCKTGDTRTQNGCTQVCVNGLWGACTGPCAPPGSTQSCSNGGTQTCKPASANNCPPPKPPQGTGFQEGLKPGLPSCGYPVNGFPGTGCTPTNCTDTGCVLEQLGPEAGVLDIFNCTLVQ